MGSGRLIRPAAGHDAEALDTSCLDCVDPGELAGGVYRHRDKHALLEALTARAEALEMVDGRQTDCRIIESDQLPDGAPGVRCGASAVGVGHDLTWAERRPFVATSANGSAAPTVRMFWSGVLRSREPARNPPNTARRRCRRQTQRASVLTAGAAVWWSAGLSWPGFR